MAIGCVLCRSAEGPFVEAPRGDMQLVVCASCIRNGHALLSKEEPESMHRPMPIEAPVRWEWDASNTLAIYSPSESVHGGKIWAQLWFGEGHAYETKEQMETSAAFICRALNEALSE